MTVILIRSVTDAHNHRRQINVEIYPPCTFRSTRIQVYPIRRFANSCDCFCRGVCEGFNILLVCPQPQLGLVCVTQSLVRLLPKEACVCTLHHSNGVCNAERRAHVSLSLITMWDFRLRQEPPPPTNIWKEMIIRRSDTLTLRSPRTVVILAKTQ